MIFLIYEFIIYLFKMISKVVQDYVLMESIGKGQYGNVYRAENKKLNKLFAVKVMSAEKFKHTPRLSEFTNNQISILTKINHPNIIRFIEMLRTANNYYLVYEYCNGGTLAQLIKSQKRLSQDQALKYFIQLRSAFEVLYKEKVLHRDLKPSNILFHNGVIKIADFGFCKEMMENDMTQTMVGSPIYMAPEILKGSYYDNRADIWSLGVILYEMLYGFCPYQESSIPKLISLIDNSLLKFPSQITISSNVKMLLKAMMMIRYRERISAAEFVKYPLQVKNREVGGIGTEKIEKTTKTLKDVIQFNRKSMSYLAQTLEILSEKIDDDKYLLMAFLVFKILYSIQKDTLKASCYWEIIKIKNTDDQWDYILRDQSISLQPYGDILRESLLSQKNSSKTQLELDTNYVDFKYYLESTVQINDNPEVRKRLINCFLINRHFMLVFEKKIIDFTNFLNDNKSFDEKEIISKKFAFTRLQ